MTPEEIKKFREELLDIASCRDTLENEVLKLYMLFRQLETEKDIIGSDYVLEKVRNLVIGHPIILHRNLWEEYFQVRLKIKQEKYGE